MPVDVPTLGLSDHFLVFVTKKTNSLSAVKKYRFTISYRSFKNFNEQEFSNDVKSLPWDIIKMFDDINDIVETYSLLMLLPLCDSVIVLCFVLRYFMSILVCNHLDGEERDGCFALFVFLVSRDCCVALPGDAKGLSAVVSVVFPDHTHFLFLVTIVFGYC